MTETDLCYLSALQLRELYQKGEVSPVEVTEAILRRMDQLNPKPQRLHHNDAGTRA